jgi:hypothetical protein
MFESLDRVAPQFFVLVVLRLQRLQTLGGAFVSPNLAFRAQQLILGKLCLLYRS